MAAGYAAFKSEELRWLSDKQLTCLKLVGTLTVWAAIRSIAHSSQEIRAARNGLAAMPAPRNNVLNLSKSSEQKNTQRSDRLW